MKLELDANMVDQCALLSQCYKATSFKAVSIFFSLTPIVRLVVAMRMFKQLPPARLSYCRVESNPSVFLLDKIGLTIRSLIVCGVGIRVAWAK